MDASKIAISVICLIAAFLIGSMTGYYISNAHADVIAQADANTQSAAVPASHSTFGLDDNNTTVAMKCNTTFSIKLDETRQLDTHGSSALHSGLITGKHVYG